MKTIAAYLQLIRPVNFLMICGGYLLMHHAGGKSIGQDPWSNETLLLTGLMALNLALAASWGYVVNDMHDLEADRRSHPQRPLVSGGIQQSEAKSFSRILLFLLLGLSAGISFYFRLWWMLPVMMGILILEYGYTHYFRKIPLAGNLITSLLVSSTVIIPMMLWVDRGSIPESGSLILFELILIYGGFAFLTTLGREIAKDHEDIIGDARAAYLSLPLVLGWSRASALLRTNLIILILFLGMLLILIWDERMIMALYGLVTVLFPIMLTYYLAFRNDAPPADARISRLLKLSMVFGLLSATLL